MIDTQINTPTDADRRQHRRIKQGLVATWIHEISARHGTVPATEEAVRSVATIEPAVRRDLDRALVA